MVAIFLGLNIGDMNLNTAGWGLMLGWLIWFTILLAIIELYGLVIYYNERSLAQPNQNRAAANNNPFALLNMKMVFIRTRKYKLFPNRSK